MALVFLARIKTVAVAAVYLLFANAAAAAEFGVVTSALDRPYMARRPFELVGRSGRRMRRESPSLIFARTRLAMKAVHKEGF